MRLVRRLRVKPSDRTPWWVDVLAVLVTPVLGGAALLFGRALAALAIRAKESDERRNILRRVPLAGSRC